jgi:hypothetical protein
MPSSSPASSVSAARSNAMGAYLQGRLGPQMPEAHEVRKQVELVREAQNGGRSTEAAPPQSVSDRHRKGAF